jgi:hypothetical protein
MLKHEREVNCGEVLAADLLSEAVRNSDPQAKSRAVLPLRSTA